MAEVRFTKVDYECEVSVGHQDNMFKFRVIVTQTDKISFVSESYCADKYTPKYSQMNHYYKADLSQRAIGMVVDYFLREKNLVVEPGSRFRRTNSLRPLKEPKHCQACGEEMLHMDGRKFKCLNINCKNCGIGNEVGN